MKKLFIMLMALAGWTSCDSPVEGNLGLDDYEPKTVVNAAISAESDLVVQVASSRGILSAEAYDYDPNALVEIVQGEQRIRLQHTALGRYEAHDRITSGARCAIEVTTAEGTVTANDYIPEPIAFEEVSVLDSVGVLDFGRIISHVSLVINDRPEEDNYYHFVLYQFGDGDTLEHIIFRSNNLSLENGSSGDVLNGSGDFIKEGLFTDKFFDGKRFTFEAQMVPIFSGRPVYVHLKSVSEAYYRYLFQLHEARQAFDDPFAEPMTVESNIVNGLGIFGGYSLALDSVFVSD